MAIARWLGRVRCTGLRVRYLEEEVEGVLCDCSDGLSFMHYQLELTRIVVI